jgi:hypothetical protein
MQTHRDHTLGEGWYICVAQLMTRRKPSGIGWVPHRVYIIHILDEGLYKVGITRTSTGRLSKLVTARRPLVEFIPVANSRVARLIELHILAARAYARREAITLKGLHGRTECWRDTAKPPSLVALEAQLREVYPSKWWDYSDPSATR